MSEPPTVPLGRICVAVGGATPSKQVPEFWVGDIPWVSPKDMKVDVITETADHVSTEAMRAGALRIVPERSVLIVVRGMILARSVPVAINAVAVTVNQDMKALVPRPGVDPGYLAYALRASRTGLLSMVEEAGHGTRCLREEMWKSLPLPVPAAEAQRAIAGFLDRKTAAINALTEKKQRLIELLAEKRAALINRAVTKGLDPNVPMKDSGVPWIGQVPAHWRVLRLKRLVARVDQGISPPADDALADPPAWGVLKAGCVNGGTFRETEHKRLPDGFSIVARLSVESGDVLVSRASGSPRLVGSAGRVRKLARNLILSDKTFRLVFGAGGDPDFMVLAMNAGYYRHQVERSISGADGLANNLPLSSLLSFSFAVPPVPEQQTIAADLAASCTAVERLNARTVTSLSLLREYRQALITAAVTGQIDVTKEDAA